MANEAAIIWLWPIVSRIFWKNHFKFGNYYNYFPISYAIHRSLIRGMSAVVNKQPSVYEYIDMEFNVNNANSLVMENVKDKWPFTQCASYGSKFKATQEEENYVTIDWTDAISALILCGCLVESTGNFTNVF